MKITMIGTSKSGKTTFGAGVYRKLMNGEVGGFKIVPRANNLYAQNVEVHKFSQDFHSLAKRAWPKGTTETQYWTLNLNYNGQHVTYFDWIDYRGGFLDDPILDPQKAQEVYANIAASDAVILFADAHQLTKYDDMEEASYHAGVDTVKQVLETYSQFYPRQTLTFIIALTKCDSVGAKWRDSNYEPLVRRGKEAFKGLLPTLEREILWQGGIVPISSVGEGATRTDANGEFELVGFPHPYNIEHVLFWCIGGAMASIKDKLVDNIVGGVEQENLLAARNRGVMGIIRHTLSKLRGLQPDRDVIEEIRQERRKDYEAFRKIKDAIEPMYRLAANQVRRFP